MSFVFTLKTCLNYVSISLHKTAKYVLVRNNLKSKCRLISTFNLENLNVKKTRPMQHLSRNNKFSCAEFAENEKIIDMPKEMSRNPVVVCVEGNIGCGKTTLLNYFAEDNFVDCDVLLEPVNKWRNINDFNALEYMYKDPQRWGMTLQTYVQLTMLQNHLQEQVHPIKMMERSIYSAKYCFTDNLFQRGVMPELEHIILTKWFDWILESHEIKVDLIVYLQTDPEQLYSRIQNRCRKEESNISLDYLKALHNLHEEWLIHKKEFCPAEVLVLDANSSLKEMTEKYEQTKKSIFQQKQAFIKN